MATDVTLGQDIYSLPDEGDNSGFGNDLSAWQKAINDVVNGLQGVNDIALTTATIANNESGTDTPIIGLKFSNSAVLTFNAPYLIVRTRGTPDDITKVESGIISGTFANGAWSLIVKDTQQDANVIFDITTAGQVTYKSDDYTGTGSYSGTIKFQAKTVDS